MTTKDKPLIDQTATWRIICRIDGDAIIIAEVFSKKSQKTPKGVVVTVKKRLRTYDEMD
jgi:phage-related protein